ncbi:MAG: hypothetical protein ACTHU0_04715 [Kofleriaceae bacterium]
MRIRLRPILAAAVLALATTAVAAADPSPDVQRMSDDDCARARKQNKTCVLVIEDETIEGGAPTHGDPPLTGRGFGTLQSLIRVRADFIQEILKTAEDL